MARDGTEFIDELHVLLRWSGLSYREIQDRAYACGGYIPEGAVAETLRNNTLPSDDLLVPLLWALGCDDDTVEMWLWSRDRVAGNVPTPFSHAVAPHADETVLHQAVQQRADQTGWRGVHRQAAPDDGPYRPKRLRAKERAGGVRGWSTAMIGLVSLGAVALAVGIAAVTLGGDADPQTPAKGGNGAPCCAESHSPAPIDTLDPQVSADATDPAQPIEPGRPSTAQTTRPPTTTQGPPPQTEGPPTLAGSASSQCESESGSFFVEVAVSVTLSGSAPGTDPLGRAGHGSLGDSFSVTGSGNSFSGVARVNVGPASEPLSGTIQWNVAVTVAGSSVNTSGSEGFSCAPSAPTGG